VRFWFTQLLKVVLIHKPLNLPLPYITAKEKSALLFSPPFVARCFYCYFFKA